MSLVLGLEVEEVENGGLDVSQVIAKHVTGVGCSLLEVTGEVQLCAQVAPGLFAFACCSSRPQNLRAVASNSSTFSELIEKAAVVICKNDILCLPFDPPVLAEKCYNRSVCFR
jgi:hypothetical protein